MWWKRVPQGFDLGYRILPLQGCRKCDFVANAYLADYTASHADGAFSRSVVCCFWEGVLWCVDFRSGVAMLSSVLRSKGAVQVNIEIMRAFVRLRELLATHADLAHRLGELEKRYDKQFAVVFDAIRQLMAPPKEPPREIGYHTLIRKK